VTIPLDASGLNFRAEPGLGRGARAFYSVKQLKTAFQVGLGPKFFLRGLQDLCPRPPSNVRGRAWRGPASKCSSIRRRREGAAGDWLGFGGERGRGRVGGIRWG
jgi:hypothetical protein